MTEKEGEILIKLARKATSEYLSVGRIIEPPKNLPQKLMTEKYGLFVTLEKIQIDEQGVWHRVLRGCIGFPEPVYPLAKAAILAAIYAATEDPRFPPVTLNELRSIIFEISILSNIRLLKAEKPSDYPKMIRVGYDGLLIERGANRGLLLPQVAVEYNWDEVTFLQQACLKAGLPPDAWQLPGTKIYVFQAQIFYELEPDGRVIERKIYLSRRPSYIFEEQQ